MKINMGCGRAPLSGYVNIDIMRYPDVDYDGKVFYKMDALVALQSPLLTDITEIRADQFLEHLHLTNGLEFLMRCKARLNTGGLLSLTLPDWGAHVADYIERKQRIPLRNSSMADGIFRPEVNVMINIIYNWGHRMVYDEEMLSVVLHMTGWENATITKPDGANLVVKAIK